MHRQRGVAVTEGRALLCRPPSDYLLVRPQADTDAPWEWPGLRLPPHASAMDLLHRLCAERLGLEVDGWTSTPPFVYATAGRRVNCQCFLGVVRADVAVPVRYAALRWVPRAHLATCRLDTLSRHIAERLLASSAGD